MVIRYDESIEIKCSIYTQLTLFFFFFKFVEITEIFDFYPYPRGKNASSSELSAVGKGSFLSCFSPIWLLSVVKLFVMGDLFL